jgi:hypothetical protein
VSLVSTFVDAFKKAAGKRPAKSEVDMKTHGPLGSTTAGGASRSRRSGRHRRPVARRGSTPAICPWVRRTRRRAANRAPASSSGPRKRPVTIR